MEQLFHNCLQVEQHNNFYIPRRFSQKQYAYYAGLEEKFKLRSFGCAGITLEFTCLSSSFSFDFIAMENKEEPIQFDIYENDHYCDTIRYSKDMEKGTVTYTLYNPSPCNVSIYLPNLGQIGIKNLNCDYTHIIKPHNNSILFLGASITQGSNLPNPSMSYASILARFFSANILNQGVGGRVFDVASFDSEIPFEANSVVIGYGGNDYRSEKSLNTLKEIANNHLYAVRNRYPSAKILLAAPLWRRDVDESPENNVRFKLVCDMLSEVCKWHHIHTIDAKSMIPHPPQYYTDSNVHPSALGYHIAALHIAKMLMQ